MFLPIVLLTSYPNQPNITSVLPSSNPNKHSADYFNWFLSEDERTADALS